MRGLADSEPTSNGAREIGAPTAAYDAPHDQPAPNRAPNAAYEGSWGRHSQQSGHLGANESRRAGLTRQLLHRSWPRSPSAPPARSPHRGTSRHSSARGYHPHPGRDGRSRDPRPQVARNVSQHRPEAGTRGRHPSRHLRPAPEAGTRGGTRSGTRSGTCVKGPNRMVGPLQRSVQSSRVSESVIT
jgi:hypothetical protein